VVAGVGEARGSLGVGKARAPRRAHRMAMKAWASSVRAWRFVDRCLSPTGRAAGRAGAVPWVGVANGGGGGLQWASQGRGWLTATRPAASCYVRQCWVPNCDLTPICFLILPSKYILGRICLSETWVI
jgi:hypothetical protein